MEQQLYKASLLPACTRRLGLRAEVVEAAAPVEFER
jgi:hypothetical protein